MDPAYALRKFFGSFNNIMFVLGHGRDELLAVHLLKTYCLRSQSFSDAARWRHWSDSVENFSGLICPDLPTICHVSSNIDLVSDEKTYASVITIST